MPRSTGHADAEYQALIVGLDSYSPPCRGDDRYVADDLDAATVAELSAGCDLCHVSALCRTYAAAEKPRAGFWAGRVYRSRELRTKR